MFAVQEITSILRYRFVMEDFKTFTKFLSAYLKSKHPILQNKPGKVWNRILFHQFFLCF